MISFSEKTAVQDSYGPRKNDNRAGGLWVPSHHDNHDRGQKQEWYNEDYTVLFSKNSKNNAQQANNNNAEHSRHLSAARNSCHLHKVRTSTTTATAHDNDTAEGTIKDWLFLEVSHDQVMIAIVLVEDDEHQDDNTHQQQHWILTEEQHYAIPGSTLQTPISGQIRSNEAPFAAAQRVTYSVLQMDGESTTIPDIPVLLDAFHLADGSIHESQQQQQLQWTFLGRYRNLADAGGGFTYTYMLKAPRFVSNAVISKYTEYQQPNAKKQKENRHLGFGTDDDRPTSLTLFSMSTDELRQSMLRGDFAEIKGAATIGLALQHNVVNNPSSLLAV